MFKGFLDTLQYHIFLFVLFLLFVGQMYRLLDKEFQLTRALQKLWKSLKR
jgi:hypothetical protein